MKRWDCRHEEYTEDFAVDAFIEDVLAVCKKHGLSIGHEDSHGAFEINFYHDHYAEWLRAAHDNRRPNPE